MSNTSPATSSRSVNRDDTSPVAEFNHVSTAKRSACEICRKRKVKCSGDKPSCARCTRLGKECAYPRLYGKPEQLDGLLDRIAALEARLQFFDGHNPPLQPASVVQPNPTGAHNPRWTTPEMMLSGVRTTAQVPLNDGGADDTSNGRMEGISLSNDGQLVAQLPIPGHLVAEIGRDLPADESSLTMRVDPNVIPPLPVIKDLLDNFRTTLGRWYPIFHIPTLLHQVEKVCDTTQLASKLDVCVVMLVFALSMTSLPQLSPRYHQWKHRSIVQYDYAMQLLPALTEIHGHMALQLLLCQLLYVFYTPAIGNIWKLTRSAASLAIDLGLHHESGPSLLSNQRSALDVDLRRRCFWILYTIEMAVCTVLGRPSAIPDNWVQTEFPSLMDDSLISHEGIQNGEASPLKATAVFRFRLRLMQSEIHERLNSPAARSPINTEWRNGMLARLDEWRDTLPSGISFAFAGKELAVTQYHLTRLMLFRASPGNQAPDVDDLGKALRSGAEVMRSHRDLYRTGQLTFNWFTVHQMFAAGLSYVNCTWQAYRNGWKIIDNYVEGLVDIQGWASVMEAVTALTPGTTGIRNAAQAISEKIVRLLSSASNPPSLPTDAQNVVEPLVNGPQDGFVAQGTFRGAPETDEDFLSALWDLSAYGPWPTDPQTETLLGDVFAAT